ncbi:hypothetical protein PHMEG_00017462 [Phytophthora megakarya]|uniref:Uncharacterized protein n=1 Tax=Phytophthora megakarya TaxID=4795 RepID=A0A225VWI8_9STRA|nr:hypothetical protein PHMEG_00017462 [Phytophthora megakarya]
MSLPLPSILTCRLNVKNGEPLTSCRNKTDPIDFPFEVGRGFRLLKAQVATEFGRKLPGEWRDEFSVFLKLSKHAPQRDFRKLEEENYDSRISRTWDLARLRLHGHSDFVLMLFGYVPKPVDSRTGTIRRAIENRIQEQVPRVAALLAERNIQNGPAFQLYMATMQARLPVDASLQVPDNATFRQLQHVDQLSQEIQGSLQAYQVNVDANFRLASIKIQGAVLQGEVHVGDLREILGLPAYSLRLRFAIL